MKMCLCCSETFFFLNKVKVVWLTRSVLTVNSRVLFFFIQKLNSEYSLLVLHSYFTVCIYMASNNKIHLVISTWMLLKFSFFCSPFVSVPLFGPSTGRCFGRQCTHHYTVVHHRVHHTVQHTCVFILHIWALALCDVGLLGTILVQSLQKRYLCIFSLAFYFPASLQIRAFI